MPQRIGVIGGGTMGRGIAACFALHGLSVHVVEPAAAKGRLAKNNAEFAARAGRIVREANGTIATPFSARTTLSLPVRASPAP